MLFISSGVTNSQSIEDQLEQSFHAGQAALQQGQFQRAADEFKKVLGIDPTLVEAQVNLGIAYHSLGQYDLAVHQLEKALHERPNLVGPAVIAGMDYLKLGSPQKGIPFLKQALKLDPSNSAAGEALASAYLEQADFGSAAGQFKQLASLDADKSEAYFKLGHEYLDLAARLAYRGAHLYHDSVWGHRFLGDLFFQRGRWEDALKEYKKAAGIDPQQPGLHSSMGQSYLHAQALQEADKEFRLEIQLDARNESGWLGLANVQLAAHKPLEALQSLQRVWEISPEFLQVQRDFPSFDLSQESAKAELPTLKSAPESPARHFLLASLCLSSNDPACTESEWKSFEGEVAKAAPRATADPCKAHQYSRCIALLEAAKTRTPAQKLLLGRSYYWLQKYESAAGDLADVSGVTKENAEASYWLARSYQALGIDSYTKLQLAFPTSWRACQMRAESAAVRGEIDDALKEFHAALDAGPNEAELHEAFGQFYVNQQTDESAAEAELERAISLDPERTHALYLLGYLHVENKDNEKAVPYLQRALRLQPDLAEANSLLGTAYLRLGKFADAVPLLQKAAPTDHYGNVHYQLFTAYRKLGKTDLAQKELALSQDLRKNYLERDEALILGSSPQPKADVQ